MKRYSAVLGLLLLGALSALAAPNVYPSKALSFPKTLTNARYVYVAAFDGDEFNPNLLPEDRAAIVNVQDALRQWGRYVIVYRPEDADITPTGAISSHRRRHRGLRCPSSWRRLHVAGDGPRRSAKRRDATGQPVAAGG